MSQSPLESPTIRRHRRQRFWQIILPLLLALALIITGVVFVTIGGSSQARLWADISIIWLVVPVLFIALLGIVLLAALVYGIARLTQTTPRFTSQAQELAMRVKDGARRGADAAVKPIIWTGQGKSVLRTFLDFLLRRR